MIDSSRDKIIRSFQREFKLSEDNYKFLDESIYKLKLNIGDKLFESDELIPGVFLILKGNIRSVFTSFENELLTIKKYKQNEIVGKFQILNPTKNYFLSTYFLGVFYL